jgi:nanoRNase/pAp phosphatase (c-di-AMP/oligoRNAs hydrolase)
MIMNQCEKLYAVLGGQSRVFIQTHNFPDHDAVASALLIGLPVDTALMTRSVCQADLEAYAALYVRADVHMVNSLLRNKIQQKELEFYRYVTEHVRVRQRFAFCYFADGCNQNLLGTAILILNR